MQLGSFGFGFPELSLTDALFLDPGDFTLTGFGGPDVGAFQEPLKIPAGITWTNRDQISVIDRGRGFTATGSGAPAGTFAAVIGANVDLPTNSSALFLCLAPPGAGSFTVPPEILANIPPTRANMLQSKSVVYVGTLPAQPTAFTAGGLDAGALLSVFLTGKTVVFR